MTSTSGTDSNSPPAGAGLGRHELGRSGVMVTELALGTAAIGNLYTEVDDGTAAATVDAAWDCGIRTFDTAPHYGLGLAERRLGAALHRRPRADFIVSTKVGRLLIPADEPHGRDTDGFAVPAAYQRRYDYSADEVAAGIAYLASPAAASVTGTALEIDGGMAGLRLRPRS